MHPAFLDCIFGCKAYFWWGPYSPGQLSLDKIMDLINGCRLPSPYPYPLPVNVEEVHQELDSAALKEHCEDNNRQSERKHNELMTE